MSEQTLDKTLAALKERLACHDIGEARAILSRALAEAVREADQARQDAVEAWHRITLCAQHNRLAQTNTRCIVCERDEARDERDVLRGSAYTAAEVRDRLVRSLEQRAEKAEAECVYLQERLERHHVVGEDKDCLCYQPSKEPSRD